MKLYDNIISDTMEALGSFDSAKVKRYPYE